MKCQIDINCDLGESFGRYRLGEQKEMLQYITSVNIAWFWRRRTLPL